MYTCMYSFIYIHVYVNLCIQYVYDISFLPRYYRLNVNRWIDGHRLNNDFIINH
jgi:hypothetical protein